MAKYVKIGSVLKSKDFAQTKNTYIKIDKDIQLKAGQFINVDDPRKKPERLAGKVSDEVMAKIEEAASRVPQFVLFELTVKMDE